MKTPDEMKKMQCPYRTLAAVMLYINRVGDPEIFERCIADSCPMWRWGGKQEPYMGEHGELEHRDCKPSGYCGLAGKP